MSTIIRDDGFHAEDWTGPMVEIAPDTAPEALPGLTAGAGLVRVAFPAMTDGRGFTLARLLRELGYTGRIRATGALIADQYAMARRVGFDAVEIPDSLAERQPEDQWKFRANWKAHDYQSRLRA